MIVKMCGNCGKKKVDNKVMDGEKCKSCGGSMSVVASVNKPKGMMMDGQERSVDRELE